MHQHSLAPGFCILNYTSNSHAHRMVLPVIPEGIYSPGGAVRLLNKSGAYATIQDCSTALINAIKGMFHTDTVFSSFEYWQKPTVADDPLFISAVTIVGGAGTYAGETVPYSQAVGVWRTALGGIFKNYLMEQAEVINTVWPPPNYGTNTNVQTWMNFFTSANNFVHGRDGALPATPLRAVSKINDKLRKKFLLD